MNKEGVLPEDELLDQASRGSETAFTELFHLYKYRLFGFMYKLTDSPEMAEDVVQEVFMKLWLNRSSLAEVENLGGYIFRMAQNQAVTEFRKRSRESLMLTALQAEVPAPPFMADDRMSTKELEVTIRNAVDRLPPQQKQVYSLSREHGLKYDQIAEKMGISPGTVKNHMIQALRTLREQLSGTSGNPLLALAFMAIVTSFAK